ncbi:hypothetical protein HYN69_17915 (plasmid) [Gemmobacter aquarius]|uniref:Leukotoxin LktA family filamentous adhesin n=1 Tax=Paragemmobacter aquarius TaxID=2169400 RepID=A0A2S0USB6_9RHOB|nr:leukotoxin LktA family filamentous adhesin [Gemmobacter aquarius]AWB50708.1 hypothetical protein HYN69_17915 [Gemmobacter aquarius]
MGKHSSHFHPEILPLVQIWQRRRHARQFLTGASPVVMGLLVGAFHPNLVWAQAVNLDPGSNNILIDGRTKTQIDTQGSVTRITTGTVSGSVGFNSFSDFEQAAGTRVDLYVPDGAGSLVNIVRNGAVVINGELNGIKDGAIGGNIFFSSSNGFIVGQNGRVNVGTLTVNTPTQEFLDRVVGADGTLNQAVADQLMRGEIPVSQNGAISIMGQVNAKGGITLQGHTVTVNGRTGPVSGDDLGQRTQFDATVNSSGLVEGGALVSQGGRIAIVATGGSRIGGRVDASNTTGKGGEISVTGGDIAIDGSAELTANGTEGGEIVVFAGDALVVQDGASFSAAGATSGGFIELSGASVNLGAITLKLGGGSGKAGKFLIDPVDLVINAGSSIASGGADITVQATGTITVGSGGALDSRLLTAGVSTGNSGKITVEAPSITLANGSQLLAGVTVGSGFAAGDVLLSAVGTSGTAASITLGGGAGAAPVISGRNVTLSATSSVSLGSLLVGLPDASATITSTAADITATGAFTAEAKADVVGGLSLLPLGVLLSEGSAIVDIKGDTRITAQSVSLSADTTVTSNNKTQSLVPTDSTADGAVAVSTITSTAIARVGGNAVLDVAGVTDITAKNSVTSEAEAIPVSAAFGASVGVSIVNAVTTAELADAAEVTTADLTLDAQTEIIVKVKAGAAAGGATEPSPGSQAATFLQDAALGGMASSGGTQVSVAGALAISKIDSATTARIDTSSLTTVSDALSVTSGSGVSAELVADGSAVESAIGVGVAVGVNIAKVSNQALIDSAVAAGSATLAAQSRGTNLSTSATSGAGAQDVGIAGSFGINLLDTASSAALGGGADVQISAAGAVALSAENETESTVEALPSEGGATGDTVGIGASLALNIVANRTVAELAAGSALTGAGDVTLAASATHVAETKAEAGSAGGISITPSLALSMVSNATTARVGTGSLALTLSGDLDVSAAQHSTITTEASGEAAGSTAAIGAAIAIALVDDRTTATTARNLVAGGDVGFAAAGASLSTLTAKASAVGAAAAEEDGTASDGKTVDDSVDSSLADGSTKQKSAGVGDSSQQAATDSTVDDKEGRSASTSEGKVSVAAAVGVNVQTSQVTAFVPDGVTVDAGGTLKIAASNNTDGQIEATGDAVGQEDENGDLPPPSQVGIGAAVAVNLVKTGNTARLGDAVHTVGGLEITADKRDVAALMADPASTDMRSDVYVARASAGAGGSKIGIAGSLALNLVDTESRATISGAATVNLTGGGDIALTADNRTDATAEALPVGDGASGGDVGIGASVALNILANRSVAEISDGAVINAAGDVSLTASATYAATTKAEAGSAGGISITPSLGLSLIANATTARVGTGGLLDVSGDITVAATQEATTTTEAGSAASGSTAAIGASLALALIDDRVIATTARSMDAGGDIAFTASGVSSSTLTSTASAAGAKSGDEADAGGEEGSTDEAADKEFQSGATRQGTSGVGSAEQKSSTSAKASDSSGRSASSSEGKVSLAAAAAINVQSHVVTAVVPDAVTMTAGGSLSLLALATTGAEAAADGQAVKSEDGAQSQVGIGVAVAVNAVTETATARLGAGATGHAVNGLSVTVAQADGADVFSASAISGAGGSSVGIAGSVALNLLTLDGSALVAGNVNAGSGAVVISAESEVEATASSAPSESGAVGGSAGVGASFAMNLVNLTTVARLEDGVGLTGGSKLSVGADSKLTTETEAKAGAAGGVAIDASVALTLLDHRTEARVGTGAALSMGAGAVTISASSEGTHKATSEGETKGSNVAVGASAAVILGDGAQNGALKDTSVTSATLARGIDAAGSLSIEATASNTYDANATATAGGGKEEKNNSTTGKTSSSADTLDKTKDSQKDQNGGSGGAKVTVAAAVGVAGAQDVVTARMEGVTVNLAGDLEVAAESTIGIAVSGIGAASNPNSRVGVGVGVGLAILNTTTSATIGDGANITAGAVTVAATSEENTGDYKSKIAAIGAAGATGSSVAVAGALAVAISTGQAEARLGDDVTITGSDAVEVTLDNTSQLSAKAFAASGSSSGVAVGASIAVVYSEKDYDATIGADADITATSVKVQATNHRIEGAPDFDITSLSKVRDFSAALTAVGNAKLLGDSNYYVEAIGGAGGNGVALQGSFAVMVFKDDMTAAVGPDSKIDVGTGSVTLGADSDYLAKALSGALAASLSSAGVGVSSTVIVSEGDTLSLLDSGVMVDAGSFTNSASAVQDIRSYAASVAAGSTAGASGVAGVITSDNSVQALIAKGARVTLAGPGTAALTADNDFKVFGLAAGAGAGGTAGVGAAVTVVTVKNVTRAALGDGTSAADRAELNTAGAVNIGADATEDITLLAAAGGAAGTAGVGAGAGILVFDTTTEALVGTFARVGQSDLSGSLTVSASDESDILVISGALGGGGTVGAGAGVGVGVIDKATKAEIGDNAVVDIGNVVVDAASRETIDSITAGIGVGGTAGLAGAVTVLSASPITTARIGADARVVADGNVAVTATDTLQLDMVDGAFAAGTVGVGASVGVTLIGAQTLARIDDRATVTARGNGGSQDYVTGFTPVLSAYGSDSDFQAARFDAAADDKLTDPDAAQARTDGLALLSQQRDATEVVASGKGVIVNAAGSVATRGLSVGGSAGAGAVSISANVPVITTQTKAEIGQSATINTVAGAASTAQDVIVAAASDTYALGFSGAVAAGGVAGGAGLGVMILDATTSATTGAGSTLRANGNIGVTARATGDMVGVAAAGAVGTVGVAGGVSVMVLKGRTTAELAGDAVAQGNVDVIADDRTRTAVLAGALAGGFVGVGAAVNVVSLDKATTARIATGSAVTALGLRNAHSVFTGTDFNAVSSTARGVNVQAVSGQKGFTLTAAGSAGGAVGASGVISLYLMNVATAATIADTASINTAGGNAGANAAQDVYVVARDDTATSSASGGVAAGVLGGLAGVVDVGVFKNSTTASIGNGVTLNARRDLQVAGLSQRAGEAYVLGAGGGFVGLAAGIAVYSYGDGVTPGGDADRNLADSSQGGAVSISSLTSTAQSQASDGTVNNQLAASDRSEIRTVSADVQAKRASIDVASAVAPSLPAGTSANIGNGTITVGGAVGVASSDDLTVSLTTGAVGGGVLAGGAGISVLAVDTGSTAQINGTGSITAGSVAVAARTDHDLQSTSAAGAAGTFVGLSATVGVINDRSRTVALLQGKTVTTGGAVSVTSTALRSVEVFSGGVSFAGVAAVGAAVAKAEIGGTVSATVHNANIASGGARAQSLTVSASATDTADAETIAAGGGVGASIQGSVALANIAPIVRSVIDAGQAFVSGVVSVTANFTGAATSEATGIAGAGGLAVAASEADSSLGATLLATITGTAVIDAQQLDVIATAIVNNLRAKASGSSGALVGVNATSASARNTNRTEAVLSAGSVTVTGDAGIEANSSGEARAEASGLAVGIVAAGFNVASATTSATTAASAGATAGIAAGNLSVRGVGDATNTAITVAGSGGLIAGSAATAKTASTATTSATLTGTVTVGDLVTVAAEQDTRFNGSVDTTQASLVGASGATLRHDVTSTVNAVIGTTSLTAKNLTLSARNQTDNDFLPGNGNNVRSISGGLANLPSAGATINVTHNTTARVNDAAVIRLARPGVGASAFVQEAYNRVGAHQIVSLDSGGAIATADAVINMDVTANASAIVGAGAKVDVDYGDIRIAAWGEADIDLRGNATTYGLAGAPSGDVTIDYIGNNSVTLGNNARIEATDGDTPTDGTAPRYATITIGAGSGPLGETADLNFNATLDLFNKTAIPIFATPDPRVTVANSANVIMGTTATPAVAGDPRGIRAAGDIRISATRGNITATAVGTGKDIYREGLAKLASAVSNAFGGGDVTFDYHGGSTQTDGGTARAQINGLVETGIQRNKTLILDACTTSAGCVSATGNIEYVLSGPFAVGTDILDRVAELTRLISDYDSDPVAKAAYQNELKFLQNKLVGLGLATFDSGGNFVAGSFVGPSPKAALLAEIAEISRNIDTLAVQFRSAVAANIVGSLSDVATTLAGIYTNPTFGLQASFNTADTAIRQLANFGASASYATTLTGIGTTLSQGVTAVQSVITNIGSLISESDANQTLVDTIVTAQAALRAAIVAGNTSAATTQNGVIATAQASLSTNLSQIASLATTILGDIDIAQARATSVRDGLNTLIDTTIPSTPVTGTDPEKAIATQKNADDAAIKTALRAAATGGNPATAGALTKIGNSKTSLDTLAINLESSIGTVQSATATLRANTGVTAGTLGGSNSLTQFIGLGNGYSQTFATKTQAAAVASNTANAPLAYRIDIADTATRLGNIFVTADQLQTSGTGSLLAPGSAKILITNNTANTLNIGNLIVPDYDAGNVRFNGVLVYGADNITTLNAGGVASGFGSDKIETSLTSSRGEVTILSTYSPESIANAADRKVAPDIILKTGSLIENLRGAVRIESAAGNVYTQGRINAGSVSILVKNGDYVASYVNGFNHIGGDPASFSIKTSTTEGGAGITANGAVSIAARYLNINSTIQSGIANWNLTLNGTPTLTASAAAIGLAQSTIDTALAANPTLATINVVNTAGQTVTISRAPLGFDAAALKTAVDTYKAAVLIDANTNPVVTLNVFGTPTLVNIKDYLSPQVAYTLQFTKAAAEAYVAATPSSDGLFSVVKAAAADNIGASYDAKAQQFVVDGTSVKGGFIQLFGQIMNTTSSTSVAKLNVLDGFGTINITNSSNIAVVLRNLSTGEDATGTLRGVAGRIEMTDVTGVNATSPSNPVVSIRKTVFTRDYVPGDATGTVKISTQTGTIDNATGNLILGAAVVTDGADRTTTYTPSGTQRYVWTTGGEFRNTVNYAQTDTQVFGTSAFTIDSITTATQQGAPVLLTTYRLADGTYVTTDSTLTGGRLTQVNGAYFNDPLSVAANTSNASLDATQLASGNSSTFDNDFVKTGESGRDCNWWTLCIVSDITTYFRLTQDYTTITTNSLKANYPIGVNFIGSNTGAINVTSANSDVVLTSNVNSVAGSASITGANIIQGDLSGEIVARGITLAASGSVGGLTDARNVAAPVEAALAVRLTGADAGTGSLSATAASGNVSLLARGKLIVDQISAAGSVLSDKGKVEIYALGAITGKDATAKIQAPRVILTSANGAVGSTADGALLMVNTGFSANPALRPFGDPSLDPLFNPNALLGLTVTASGDIGIRSAGWSGNTDGTILADRVRSSGGDVRLSATGQILDNNPVEGIDQRTYDQLLGYWESLGLLANDAARGVDGSVNTAKTANLIKAFETATTASYNQYWQIRGTGAYDAAKVVTVDPASSLFRVLDAQFRADAIASGAPDANAYVTQRIADYEAQKTAEYHRLNGEVGGLTASYDAAYAYTATDAQKASLTDGSVWTERELAFSLAPGALKTVTGTNPVLKDPNVSGRSVTIEAGRGIGETVGAGTLSPGVAIRGDTDPRNLTLDQKVALAAAERSDLQLTVGPVRLPVNATTEQIAAYNAAIALGLGAPGASTTLLLGAEFTSLTATQQAAFNAAALGLIDPATTVLTVLSKRPLNFDAAETLNIAVPNVTGPTSDIGAAYLASRGGATLGSISTYGETRIKVFGDIVNASTSSVRTGTLILESAQGYIGSPTVALALDPRSGASVTARAQNGVNLGFAGNAVIDTVFSPKAVKITAQGSILNANNDDLINVLGGEVNLQAVTGTIGTLSRALNVGVSIGGKIVADALGSLNLYGAANARFVIGSAMAGSTISLGAFGESTIDGPVETDEAITITAGGRVVLTGLAEVSSTAGTVRIASASLKMLDGAEITAEGAVTVVTTGDALVTQVTSNSTSATAVSVDAGGRIFSGKSPVTDITAMATGAGVSLTAGLGIGDKTQANLTADVNTVTDTPNRLRIRTNTLAATATTGDIVLSAETAMTLSNVTATAGGIDVLAASTLSVTAATSAGDQIFDATGALTFTQLTTTGSGDITATSDGTVTGGFVTSGGSASLTGSTVGFDTITADDDVTLTAVVGPVTGGSVTAGGDIGATGTGVTLGTLDAGRDVTLDGKTALVDATSVTAGGSVDATGTGLTLGTLDAGVDITLDGKTALVDAGSLTAGGDIDATGTGLTIDALDAEGDITLAGKTGAVTLVTLDAGGNSSITGAGVGFDTLIAGGDSEIYSTGDIIGTLEQAGETLINVAGFGAGNSGKLDVKTMRARVMELQSTSTLDVGRLEVAESLTLRADVITALDVAQVPSGPDPLSLVVTGANGGVATKATLSVDAVAGLVIPTLRVSETVLDTTARQVTVESAELPLQGTSPMAGTLLVETPDQTVLVDARSITPKGTPDSNVQIFTQGAPLSFALNGTVTRTDGYVVTFDETVQVTNVLGVPFAGISTARDSVRNLLNSADAIILPGAFGSVTVEEDPDVALLDGEAVVIDGVAYKVYVPGNGPAVLLPQ